MRQRMFIPLLLVGAVMAGCTPSTSSPVGHGSGPRVVLGYQSVANGPQVLLPTTVLKGFPYSKVAGPMVVNLWASWCGPCRQEAPKLIAAHGPLLRAGIALVGVDTEDSPDNGAKFAKSKHWPWPQRLDEDGRLLHRLHFMGLPDTLLIDAGGRLRGYFTGPIHSTMALVRVAQANLKRPAS